MQASTTKPSEITTVAVAKVSTEDLSHGMVLTAEFKPFQEVDVMAKVAGYIKQINVDVGDRVQQGQLLATLEIPEMADDLRRADAAVERARAEVARAQDELARARIRRISIAHLSFQRLSAVAQKKPGLIAQQEIDEAQSRDLVAEAQVAAAKSALAAAQEQVNVNPADTQKVKTLMDYTRVLRAVRRGDHQALRRYRIHDSGRHGLADAGHAGGAAFGEQPAAADSAGAGIGRARRCTSGSRWRCGFRR